MSYVLERPKRYADTKKQYKKHISASHMFLKNRPSCFKELESVVCGSLDRDNAWRALQEPGAMPRLQHQSPSMYGRAILNGAQVT